jgi:hypothetical protein
MRAVLTLRPGFAGDDPFELLSPVPTEDPYGRAVRRCLQRLRVRLSVRRGEAPLRRSLGLPPDLLDRPIQTALPALRVAVAAAVRAEAHVSLVSVAARPDPQEPGAAALAVTVLLDVPALAAAEANAEGAGTA